MIVFPGEERLLRAHGFALTQREMAGYPVWFATCSGRCRRVARPLSCRIFPLAPLYERQNLTIVPDPRARAVCPLLSAHAVEQSFAHAVKAAFEVLTQDERVREMLVYYTKMLREYQAFWRE